MHPPSCFDPRHGRMGREFLPGRAPDGCAARKRAADSLAAEIDSEAEPCAVPHAPTRQHRAFAKNFRALAADALQTWDNMRAPKTDEFHIELIPFRRACTFEIGTRAFESLRRIRIWNLCPPLRIGELGKFRKFFAASLPHGF